MKAIIHHVKHLPELEDVLHSRYTWLICRVERAQTRLQTGNKLLELPFLDPWLRCGLCDLHFIITHIPANILSLQHIRYAKRHACHLNSGCREREKKKGLKIPDLLCFTSSSPSPPWAKVEYWWNFSGVLQSWVQVSEGLLNIELEFNKTMTHTHEHPKYHFEGFSFKRSSFLALQFERNILLPAVKAPEPSSWCRNSQGFKSHWCLETYAWYSTLPAAVKMPRVWYLWITKANCL